MELTTLNTLLYTRLSQKLFVLKKAEWLDRSCGISNKSRTRRLAASIWSVLDFNNSALSLFTKLQQFPLLTEPPIMVTPPLPISRNNNEVEGVEFAPPAVMRAGLFNLRSCISLPRSNIETVDPSDRGGSSLPLHLGPSDNHFQSHCEQRDHQCQYERLGETVASVTRRQVAHAHLHCTCEPRDGIGGEAYGAVTAEDGWTSFNCSARTV